MSKSSIFVVLFALMTIASACVTTIHTEYELPRDFNVSSVQNCSYVNVSCSASNRTFIVHYCFGNHTEHVDNHTEVEHPSGSDSLPSSPSSSRDRYSTTKK